MSFSPSYDMLMKLAIVGDSGVGKSCLITSYCENFFPVVSNSTVGVDFRVKMLETENKVIKLQLWDTAGDSHGA